MRNRIQISTATADLLKQAGKAHWVRSREDGVHAKGKGVLNTFWLDPTSKEGASGSSTGSESNSAEESQPHEDAKASKQQRLVDWVVEILLGDIKKIVSDCESSCQFSSIFHMVQVSMLLTLLSLIL